jgi:LuxR family maltose regulon positive regulatory protein
VLGDTHNGARMLEELERKNLFLIPLDDERQWFRYHHLFSELLFQNLKRSQSETVDALYQRAADWFERNGHMEDAVGYALKAGNYEYATQLMNQIRIKFLNRGDLHQLLDWIRIFPEELVRAQPELCFNYASLLTMQGYFEVADNWLKLAEAGIGQFATSDRHVPLNEHRFVIYRSVYARFRGDFAAAVALAQRALELVPVTMVRDYGVILLFLGQAYFYAGNTGDAERILAASIQANLTSGHMEAYINTCHNLAQLRVLQGRLQDARAIYEQAAQVASEHGKPILAGTEHAGLADLKREWNLLEEAAIEIEKGVELAEAGDHIFSLIDVYLARVRLAQSQKDWDSAQNYLQKAVQVARRSPTSIEIAYLQTWQAWLNLAQGKLVEAARWAGTKNKEDAGPFDFYGEFEMLMLARVWLAEGKTDLAASALEGLYTATIAAGRFGRAIEALLLLALADQALGKETQAVERLTRVLAQAEPEGYIRLFIDDGAPMARLLYKAASQLTENLGDYAKRLLAVYLQEEAEWQVLMEKTLHGDRLIKPLSERELEVLRLVAAGKTNQEIAAALYIAIGTVKRHVINIYTKLDAKNRTEAVAIARQLDLLNTQ